MIQGPVKGAMGMLTYNARNQLTSAGDLRYTYDSNGNRKSVSNSVYGSVTTTVVNPVAALSQTLLEKDASGNVIAYYVYGMGLVGMELADGSYYTQHYDLRGSTVALTKLTVDNAGVKRGEVTDRYAYGSFGEVVARQGTTRNQYLYNGRDGVITDDNGLYYMRARYYSPDMKRFVNEDVVLGGVLNGQSLNRFAYVNGNPISSIDPLGREAESAGDSGWGSTALDILQGGLDIGGLFPVLGEPLDGINAGIYWLRGDNVSAGLSVAGMVPIAGWGATGAKVGRKVIKATDEVVEVTTKKTIVKMTAGEAKVAAKELGYEPTNYFSLRQPVFKKGNKYITPDVGSGNGLGSHNAGVWKMADSVEKLAKKDTRLGTYDADLNRIGD
jgi:RHS repeat-associated protein